MSRSLTSIKVCETEPENKFTITNKDTAVFARSHTSDLAALAIMKQEHESKTIKREDNNTAQNSTSSLNSSKTSTCENCSKTTPTSSLCKKTRSPYLQLLWTMENDSRWKSERSQGRIVGMYKILGEIGSGNFAKVKLGVHQLTKEKVAIKIIDKVRKGIEPFISREVATMESMSHRNLIRLFEVLETSNRVYLISEWAPAGDLYTKVTLKGFLTEAEAKPIFQQILAAVAYMVGDFGFSTAARNGRQLTTFCGSPPYAAPELFRDESYEGSLVDIWALGVLCYFMTHGTLPFVGSTIPALKKVILNGHYTTSEHLSEECTSLIAAILCQKPVHRLTISKIIRHPWLTSVLSPAEIERNDTTLMIRNPQQDNQGVPQKRHEILARQDTLNLLMPKIKPLTKTIPTPEQQNFGLLSGHEEQALKLLHHCVGVDERLISLHRAAGVRSHIVGIYRIILHKLQMGHTWSPRDFYVPEHYATSTACAVMAKKYAKNGTKKSNITASGLVAHLASTGVALVPPTGGGGKSSKSVQSNTCTML